MENRQTIVLADLPPELLCLIAENTESYTTISALARTTRFLHQVVNHYVYLRNSTQAGGGYALLWAARHGNESTLRLALECRTSLSCSRSLLVASRHGHHGVVKHLLSVVGVDIQTKDSNGDTALTRAIREGHEAIVRTLLEAGALPHPERKPLAHQREVQTALFLAIEKGNARIVKQLLASSRVSVKAMSKDKHSALSLAAKMGDTELVQPFLDLGVSVNTVHERGQTPLTYAIESNSPGLVNLLLDYGADPNTLHLLDGNTPIFIALEARSQRAAILQTLVDCSKVNVNHVNALGISPLSAAIRGSNGRYHVGRCSDSEIAILLTRNDLDPNLGDIDSLTRAIGERRTEIAEIIIADPRITHESKFKALHEALTQNDTRSWLLELIISDALMKPLFDSFIETHPNINAPIINSMSFLMRACFIGHETAVNLLLDQAMVHPDSRAYGDLDIALYYPSPLHCAIRGGHTSIVKRLLRTGQVDINSPMGLYGRNAFLAAAQFSRIDILPLLRDRTEADPNVTDARGMCAAAIIADKKDYYYLLSDMREVLMWAGVNVRTRDEEGKSALDYAVERKNRGLVYMLTMYMYGYAVELEHLQQGIVRPSWRTSPPMPDFFSDPQKRGKRSRNGKKAVPIGFPMIIWSNWGRYSALGSLDSVL